jgi:hypothetical protein
MIRINSQYPSFTYSLPDYTHETRATTVNVKYGTVEKTVSSQWNFIFTTFKRLSTYEETLIEENSDTRKLSCPHTFETSTCHVIIKHEVAAPQITQSKSSIWYVQEQVSKHLLVTKTLMTFNIAGNTAS